MLFLFVNAFIFVIKNSDDDDNTVWLSVLSTDNVLRILRTLLWVPLEVVERVDVVDDSRGRWRKHRRKGKKQQEAKEEDSISISF